MTIAKKTSRAILNDCLYVPNQAFSINAMIMNFKNNIISKAMYFISLAIFSLLLTSNASLAFDDDIPITTDNRIKTYIYNPNEVYLLVLHFGYQSHLEFAKGEEIQTISLGDSYAWKITPLANRLFIKPLEKNMRTNMTIITNKRTYQFDIVSQELEMGEEKDLVYVIRFYYPKKNSIAK